MSSYRSVVIAYQNNWMSNVSSDGKDDYCSPPPIKSANRRLTTNEIRTSSRLEHRSHANSENRVADETTLLLSLDNKLHDTSNTIDDNTATDTNNSSIPFLKASELPVSAKYIHTLYTYIYISIYIYTANFLTKNL